MARSDEAEAWFHAVCEAVQEIPHGRVTSYGHIAKLLGCRSQVGIVMKHLPSTITDGDLQYHNGNVPWQRVINSKGVISPRGVGGAQRQAEALKTEGVEVGRSNMGELTVDFETYGWFPDRLTRE